MNHTPLKSDDELDLADLSHVLWEGRKRIVAAALACTLFSTGLAFVLPKTYTAEAALLPIENSGASSALMAGLVTQLGPLAGMLGDVGGSNVDDMVEILNSRSVVERVINNCGLAKEMKGWKYRSQLIKKVRKKTRITRPTLKNKAVLIEFDAADPELASKVVAAYIVELTDTLNRIHIATASNHRQFLADQLKETQETLVQTENRLAEFQAKNRLTSLPDTVVAAIKSLSDLEAQRLTAAVELKGTEEALGAVRSRVHSLQADPRSLVELEVKRRGLAAQEAALAKAQNDFLRKLGELPPKGLELARLQRDVQVHNTVYLALTQQYETAVLSEKREVESFFTLDPPIVPDRHSKPNRSLIALLGLVLGLIIGSVWAIGRRRSLPQDSAKPPLPAEVRV